MPRLRPRDHAVVDRQLVGEVAALRHADRVDVADQVGDGRVGRGELLGVPVVARRSSRPARRRRRSATSATAARADRAERMVVDLAPVDHGDALVKQVDDRADQPRLRLAALPQQDQVVPREDPALQRRAAPTRRTPRSPGNSSSPRSSLRQQVLAQLVLDGAVGVSGGAQRSDRCFLRHPVRVSRLADNASWTTATQLTAPQDGSLGRARVVADRPKDGGVRNDVDPGSAIVPPGVEGIGMFIHELPSHFSA